jgi:hypothetical protein
VTHFDLDTTAIAPPTRTRTTRNVSLESKPWMYVSQRSAAVFTDTPGFFYAVGYINCDTGNDWLQTSHFIVRAAEYNADGDGRPIPVAQVPHADLGGPGLIDRPG